MHKHLRELLHSARGQSQHVVVVFLDIRGFSSFAKIAESSDAAEFLKSVYIKILDDYFPDASFFKLTGDGLLVLFAYDATSLNEVIERAVRTSIQLVKDFPRICDHEPMVNFDVPGGLGVGLARGAATVLTSGELVLDYSGRPLNLAARLMDLARPSGVVIDDRFGFDLLDEATRNQFAQDTVYIKGIAEDDPITVYCLAGHTEVPAMNKSPMNRLVRHTEPTETTTFREVTERGSYLHPLELEPARSDDIEVHFEYPALRANKTKHPSLVWAPSRRATHRVIAGRHYASLDYGPLIEMMRSAGVRDGWKVKITVEYSIRSETSPEPATGEGPVSPPEATSSDQ